MIFYWRGRWRMAGITVWGSAGGGVGAGAVADNGGMLRMGVTNNGG